MDIRHRFLEMLKRRVIANRLYQHPLLRMCTTVQDSIRVIAASATKTLGSGSIPGRVKTKTIKSRYSLLPCMMFSIKRDKVKHSSSVVDKWAARQLDSKTEKSLYCLLAKAAS